MRRTIVFSDRDGRFRGKVRVKAGGGYGNKHFNRRHEPRCPEPGCDEPFSPVCPNRACEGHRVPRNVMRAEMGWEPRPRVEHGKRRQT